MQARATGLGLSTRYGFAPFLTDAAFSSKNIPAGGYLAPLCVLHAKRRGKSLARHALNPKAARTAGGPA
jgi:hypothetical protein